MWLEPDNLLRLQAWARDGLIDEQIAHNMEISVSTLYDWKNKYSDISEALKKGKEVVDIEVENALLKRALGYKYDEVTEIMEEGALTQKKTVHKQLAPDTTALIFWLKNRRPDLWRDINKQELTGKDGNPIEVQSTVQIYLPDNQREDRPKE